MYFKNSLGRVVCFYFFSLLPSFLFSEEAPPLIDIKELSPSIRIEMRYATPDNFTGKVLYPIPECLLCEPAAFRLARVQKNLAKKGLGLKVWDCYRPLSIQKKLWDIVPDPRYVADPKTGSRHNRGASVDLTLVDKNGNELLMPTAFDEFSEKAHRDYKHLPKEVIANRSVLQEAMEREGFLGLPTEWWHFDAPEWSDYVLRDEPLGSTSLKRDIYAMSLNSLPQETKQLVVVVSPSRESTTGQLQRYEKSGDQWKKQGTPWDVVLGLKGLTPALQKREGDLKSPLGLFKIGTAYGYDGHAPRNVAWPYQALTQGWICVDDPNSQHYNRVFLPKEDVSKDWSSAETMRRSDDLYKWVINIESNSARVPQAGSCIFLHVWRSKISPTEGCTAMEEKNIITLLQWLKPEDHPYLLQLSQQELTQIPL